MAFEVVLVLVDVVFVLVDVVFVLVVLVELDVVVELVIIMAIGETPTNASFAA